MRSGLIQLTAMQGDPSITLPRLYGAHGVYRAWQKDQWTAHRARCAWCREHPPRLWAYRYQHDTDPAWKYHTDQWYCGFACYRAAHPAWPVPKKPVPPPAQESLLWDLCCWLGWAYIISRLF